MLAFPTKLQSAPTLPQLAEAWQAAKDAEGEARARRVAIEEQIAALLPANTPEARATKGIAIGDREFRVTVQYKVTRKVDSDALGKLWGDLSPKAQAAFKWSADVALKPLRELREWAPKEYEQVAAVIETKPAKPAVTIEPAKE